MREINAQEFIALWKREHDELLRTFCEPHGETAVASAIANLGLTDEQRMDLIGVLRLILTDVFYTLLLGLDGEASIGGHQAHYTILDEPNTPIGAPGEIEAEAWAQSHGEPDG